MILQTKRERIINAVAPLVNMTNRGEIADTISKWAATTSDLEAQDFVRDAFRAADFGRTYRLNHLINDVLYTSKIMHKENHPAVQLTAAQARIAELEAALRIVRAEALNGLDNVEFEVDSMRSSNTANSFATIIIATDVLKDVLVKKDATHAD